VSTSVDSLYESCAIAVSADRRVRNPNPSSNAVVIVMQTRQRRRQPPYQFARRNRHGVRRLNRQSCPSVYPGCCSAHDRRPASSSLQCYYFTGAVAMPSRARKKKGGECVCDLDRWVAVLEEPARRGKRAPCLRPARRRGAGCPSFAQEPVGMRGRHGCGDQSAGSVKGNMRLTIVHD